MVSSSNHTHIKCLDSEQHEFPTASRKTVLKLHGYRPSLRHNNHEEFPRSSGPNALSLAWTSSVPSPSAAACVFLIYTLTAKVTSWRHRRGRRQELQPYFTHLALISSLPYHHQASPNNVILWSFSCVAALLYYLEAGQPSTAPTWMPFCPSRLDLQTPPSSPPNSSSFQTSTFSLQSSNASSPPSKPHADEVLRQRSVCSLPL